MATKKAAKKSVKKSSAKKTSTKKSAKKSTTRKYSPAAGKQVETEMREMNAGKLKPGVSNKVTVTVAGSPVSTCPHRLP